MDLTLLSAALKESLLQSQSVVLPGIGTFTITEVPSAFLNGGKTLTPPALEITFSATHLKNDGELEAVFSRLAKLTPEEAMVKMALLIEKIRTSIHVNRQAYIPEFGTILLDNEYQFHFTPDKDYCFCPDYYLLEPLSLKPEEGEIEILPELASADIPVFIDENPSGTNVWIIKDGEPQPETTPAGTTEIPTPAPTAAPATATSPSDPVGTGITTPTTAIPPSDPIGTGIATPAWASPESASQAISHHTTAIETATDTATITPAAIETATASTDTAATTTFPASPATSHKWLRITLVGLGVLVLACVFIYLFRTELTPILEKLLYTREELDILRQVK